jgi:hypothetical protein
MKYIEAHYSSLWIVKTRNKKAKKVFLYKTRACSFQAVEAGI